MTAMLLSSQAASLRCLLIVVTEYGLCSSELGILAAMMGLQALDVRVGGASLDDRGLTVFRTASLLTALQQLNVLCSAGPDEDGAFPQHYMDLPRCCDVAQLRSQSLMRLSVSVVRDRDVGDTENVLRLVGVPNLVECHLFGDHTSTAFVVDSTSFTGCTGLQHLTLHHHRALSLQSGCFDVLSALTSLTLTDCGLSDVPSVIAPLTALRSLDLSQNEQLQVDSSAVSLLCSLRKLRSLNVAKSEPATHKGVSVQNLFHLVWYAQHCQQLHLLVNFDADLSDTYQQHAALWGQAVDEDVDDLQF